MTRELQSIIGGELTPGDNRALDRNPARPDEIIAQVSLADHSLATEAIACASAALDRWRSLPAPARGEVLRRASDILESRAVDIGRDLALEEGKTLGEAIGETRRAAAIFRYFAGQTLEPDGETYPSHTSTTLLFAWRESLGVVVAITPWNFPIAIPAWKIAPALAYGNTVVWKPADIVPLTATHLFNALQEAGLPQGVLNLVIGKGSVVGRALTTDHRVEAVTFTGSNLVGEELLGTAASRGKKVQVELGGKNPAVVLADADIGLAAEHIARAAYLSAGQKCTATSRVIVERSVFESFVQRLVEHAKTWRVGDPLDEQTVVGPLSSAAQLRQVSEYVSLAQSEGAETLAGGEELPGPDGGYFYRPTVLNGLSPSSRVMREEIFGPVVCLLQADSYEEAVSLANDTLFGLAASVFTRDLEHAVRFAKDIHAGVVKVNQESAGLEFHVPFGGMGRSSSGSREQGKVARDFFTQWKTVYVDIPPASIDGSAVA